MATNNSDSSSTSCRHKACICTVYIPAPPLSCGEGSDSQECDTCQHNEFWHRTEVTLSNEEIGVILGEGKVPFQKCGVGRCRCPQWVEDIALGNHERKVCACCGHASESHVAKINDDGRASQSQRELPTQGRLPSSRASLRRPLSVIIPEAPQSADQLQIQPSNTAIPGNTGSGSVSGSTSGTHRSSPTAPPSSQHSQETEFEYDLTDDEFNSLPEAPPRYSMVAGPRSGSVSGVSATSASSTTGGGRTSPTIGRILPAAPPPPLPDTVVQLAGVSQTRDRGRRGTDPTTGGNQYQPSSSGMGNSFPLQSPPVVESTPSVSLHPSPSAGAASNASTLLGPPPNTRSPSRPSTLTPRASNYGVPHAIEGNTLQGRREPTPTPLSAPARQRSFVRPLPPEPPPRRRTHSRPSGPSQGSSSQPDIISYPTSAPNSTTQTHGPFSQTVTSLPPLPPLPPQEMLSHLPRQLPFATASPSLPTHGLFSPPISTQNAPSPGSSFVTQSLPTLSQRSTMPARPSRMPSTNTTVGRAPVHDVLSGPGPVPPPFVRGSTFHHSSTHRSTSPNAGPQSDESHETRSSYSGHHMGLSTDSSTWSFSNGATSSRASDDHTSITSPSYSQHSHSLSQSHSQPPSRSPSVVRLEKSRRPSGTLNYRNSESSNYNGSSNKPEAWAVYESKHLKARISPPPETTVFSPRDTLKCRVSLAGDQPLDSKSKIEFMLLGVSKVYGEPPQVDTFLTLGQTVKLDISHPDVHEWTFQCEMPERMNCVCNPDPLPLPPSYSHTDFNIRYVLQIHLTKVSKLPMPQRHNKLEMPFRFRGVGGAIPPGSFGHDGALSKAVYDTDKQWRTVRYPRPSGGLSQVLLERNQRAQILDSELAYYFDLPPGSPTKSGIRIRYRFSLFFHPSSILPPAALEEINNRLRIVFSRRVRTKMKGHNMHLESPTVKVPLQHNQGQPQLKKGPEHIVWKREGHLDVAQREIIVLKTCDADVCFQLSGNIHSSIMSSPILISTRLTSFIVSSSNRSPSSSSATAQSRPSATNGRITTYALDPEQSLEILSSTSHNLIST